LRDIANRGGYVTWDVDRAGWRVDLHRPEPQDFQGLRLEIAFGWCLVWLLYDELWLGAFGAGGYVVTVSAMVPPTCAVPARPEQWWAHRLTCCMSGAADWKNP
jgi:hypothetical protein